MNLSSRIKALERHVEKTQPAVCGACGFFVKSGESPTGQVVYRVPMPRVIGEPGAVGDQANDLCPGCGRTLVYHMMVPRVLDVAG